MQPIISIVGMSDSGKTTLLEKLIGELKRRGYRVAALKHSADDVELDMANKDTWRFTRAGSDVSSISSAHKLAIFRKLERDISPGQMPFLAAWDCDVILTEGYKQSHYPKIEVHRKEQGTGLVAREAELLALVTDEPFAVDVPQFAHNEVASVADLIERRIREWQRTDELDISINGGDIPAGEPVKDLLVRTLLAMLTGLTGEEMRSVSVSFRRKT